MAAVVNTHLGVSVPELDEGDIDAATSRGPRSYVEGYRRDATAKERGAQACRCVL